MKKTALRVGSQNLGNMTASGREVACMMTRRRIGVLCIQETRWQGNKAREMEERCQMFYSGANKERNGAGVLLDSERKEHIVGINRTSDRVMSVKLMYGKDTVYIISACAPQVGSSDEDKENF